MTDRARAPLLLLMAGLTGAACGPQELTPTRETAFVAPNLSGTYLDEAGVLHTMVQTLDVLAFGEEAAGELPGSGDLVGYEFLGQPGAIPLVGLVTDLAGSAPALALYGPRSARGLWGDALALVAADEAGTLELPPTELPGPGSYFLLLLDRADLTGSFTLSLGCRGSCPESPCPDMEPCDLACEDGFLHDTRECRRCECVGAAHCDDGAPCPSGQECTTAGICGAVAPACASCPSLFEPVCGSDGRTYGNSCQATCRGVLPVRRGACAEPPRCDHEHRCPAGLICLDGTCREPDCDCPTEEAPVCSESGRTWRNRCELECRPDERLAYTGPCQQTGCRWHGQCPEGSFCLPSGEPDNLERCFRDPWGPDCQRECRSCDCPVDPEASPVCGNDGQTYPSACHARCAGILEVATGSCPESGCVCAPSLRAVCGADGVIYANDCELRCAQEDAPTAFASCLGEEVVLACQDDGDCQRTGCAQTVCAAAPTEACPSMTQLTLRLVAEGRCGCREGTCTFASSRHPRDSPPP